MIIILMHVLLSNFRYQHHLLPPNSSRNSQRTSIQDDPLPPPPPPDPIYEELCQNTLVSNQTPKQKSIRVSFNAVNENSLSEEDDEEFLKPVADEGKNLSSKSLNSVTESDGYLTPKSVKKQRSGSQDDEYLRPTFNQMSRINSRDLSPPPNDPPPIPMQSYSPLRKQSE